MDRAGAGKGIIPFTKSGFDGAPDWIAAVISEGTRAVDEEDRRVEYAAAGVPEYWLVDPAAKQVRVLLLDGVAYRELGLFGVAGHFDSPTLIGFQVQVADLFDADEAHGSVSILKHSLCSPRQPAGRVLY